MSCGQELFGGGKDEPAGILPLGVYQFTRPKLQQASPLLPPPLGALPLPRHLLESQAPFKAPLVHLTSSGRPPCRTQTLFLSLALSLKAFLYRRYLAVFV